MSDLSPVTKGAGLETDLVLNYASPVRRVSRLAIWSMWLGIIGILTSVFGIGLLIGPIALVTGIISLVLINMNPMLLRGKGYAVAGMVAGPLALLASSMLLPCGCGRPREMANRGICAANLRGIAQSMAVYAGDNGDVFPVVPFAPFGVGNGGTSAATGGATGAAAVAIMETPGNPVAGSPLAGPWLLCVKGSVSPKEFICKSDSFAARPSPASLADGKGDVYVQFQAEDQISYSFAYPYTREGKVGEWWMNTTDASIPIASDMVPVPGTGSPKRMLAASGASEGNSGNHGGDGQNVAYADNHVDFVRNTGVGQGGDNIFTVSGRIGGSATGTAPGLAPINISGTPGDYDTVMVPERNLDSGKLW